MMVAKDEWTSAAMTDDVLVVELLLRLKESRAASSSSSSLLHYPFTAKSVIPRWGLRLPRSKASAAAASSSRCDAVCRTNNSKKDDSTRCSPTTPLSWSGGGSPSGTADGFEESSRPRSKGTATYESTSTTNGIKRARKKKSYDELKEEETSLLKERTNLRKEIATLQTTFKEQRAKNENLNENLKRVKLDLNLHSSATNLIAYFDGAENAIASQPHQRIAPPSFGHFPSHLLLHATPYVHPYPQLDSCDEHKAASSSGNNSFVLPDLNMVPFEEDSGSEMLYGMS